MQMKASVVPLNLTIDLEANIESQNYKIQSLQIHPETKQDSLNSWKEVNLNSMQGVCVDESVASSTSSQQNYGTSNQSSPTKLEVTPSRAHFAESSIKIGCSSEYTTRENLKNSSVSSKILLFLRLFHRLEVQRLQ